MGNGSKIHSPFSILCSLFTSWTSGLPLLDSGSLPCGASVPSGGRIPGGWMNAHTHGAACPIVSKRARNDQGHVVSEIVRCWANNTVSIVSRFFVRREESLGQ